MTSGVQEFGDWDEFAKQLDPRRFRAQLKKEIGQANAYIGSVFVAEARKAIQGAAYAPNSPMTEAFKGSSKPLVNDGDLIGSLTWAHDEADRLAVWVGVNRMGNHVNIAKILHDGATLKVTKKMLAALFARMNELAKGSGRKAQLARDFLSRWKSKPGSGKLSGPAKAKQRAFLFAKLKREGRLAATPPARPVWVIPPRPFITSVVGNPAFLRTAIGQWMGALDRALHASSGGQA